MKKSGSINNAGLTVKWEINLDGNRAQLTKKPSESELVASTRFTAEALFSAELSTPAPMRVRGAMINMLMQDRKELHYRPKKGNNAAPLLVKLTKRGPLWDPTDEAMRAGCFPYSTVPVEIPIDGNQHKLFLFDDSPFIRFPKTGESQKLVFMNGLTTFLIVLVALITEGSEEEEPVILFRAKWIIDWRFRPKENGWNAQGEPMVFEVAGQSADDAIDELHARETANGVEATKIESTWKP